ncbi:MAG TPA: hypothetical protein PKM65_15315 [Spirochaetota bacterium]|nr:hypothetical protein [Spirochaetota bacterium]HNT10396.1 hypothetical protein [Spirochaetota bacterium]HNV48534.1 hypothetical protein [Spirochaetota bacterium]HOS39475.1 hypothetical protein [Spirochaetota bacterium]HPU89202.1 hypothetical protein [Spirochaetota bacterium]
MGIKRKQYVLDKAFQLGITLKAVVVPLVTILIFSGVLIYFANQNNTYIRNNDDVIKEIVGTQESMIEMFLRTPALYKSENEAVRNGQRTFEDNIGKLMKINKTSRLIVRNSSLVLYALILMTVVQTAIIFILFIYFTHKISGPMHVMTNHLRAIRQGKKPHFRPLRKRDEFQAFYIELKETIDYLSEKK